MLFAIDTRSRIPVYEQLEQLIIKYVSLGLFAADEQLPSVRAMAQELGINPNTVQKAYKSLEARGVIYTVTGRGAFVSSHEQSLDMVKKLAADKFGESVRSARDTGLGARELKAIVDNIYGGAV